MALEAFGVDNRQVFVTLLERAQGLHVATSTADVR
jgi:hypothetical protein